MGAPSEPREVVSTVLFHTKCVSSPGQCFRENTPDALGGKTIKNGQHWERLLAGPLR